MTGNYDITFRSLAGEITFYGSKRGSDGILRSTGYTPPLEGLGDPGRRTTTTVKSGADGGIVVPSDQQYDMRQIPLDAFAMCDSIEDIEQVTANIRAAMPIRENILLLVKAPSGNTFGSNVVVTKCSPSIVYSDGARLLRDYAIEAVAADPYWYDYNQDGINSVALNKLVPGGLQWTSTGAQWSSTGLPWTSGSGNETVANTGDEDVYPLITITGVTHNPVITNISTGLAFQLGISTTATDVIEIDMDAETVTLNGGPIMNNITTKNWWALTPGNNTIGYDSASIDDSAQVVLSWRNRYMEVS